MLPRSSDATRISTSPMHPFGTSITSFLLVWGVDSSYQSSSLPLGRYDNSTARKRPAQSAHVTQLFHIQMEGL